MTALNTIGFTKTSLEGFVGRLREAKVDQVIDVRLRPGSQLSGFAKKTDLEFVLRHYEGIEYVHAPDLAPTPDILDGYRQSKDWRVYEIRFRELMEQRDMMTQLLALIGTHQSTALLCSEDTPDKCHRRLLAESLVARQPMFRVSHL